MPGRSDQGMPGRYWKPIPNEYTMLASMDDPLGWKGAKGASGPVKIQP